MRPWTALIAFFIAVGVDASSFSVARGDIFRVDLEASALNYTGSCPIDIVFTATIDGDPGTIFSYQFSGKGFGTSQKLYGFVPDSRTQWFNDDIKVDSAHAGTFERVVEVSDYGPASHHSSSPLRTLKSQVVDVDVTCVAPGGTAAPSPASAGTPTAPPAVTSSAVSSTGSPEPALFGVSVGEDPATVLARFHLHPPGWAKSSPPKGMQETSEVREFPVDGTTDMIIIFDSSIEIVLIRSTPGVASTATDPFGVRIGETSEQLEALRGRPDLESSTACSDNCAVVDQVDVLNGLFKPVSVDKTFIYGSTTSVRWEYAVKGDAIVSIRAVDCRVPGICSKAPPSAGAHPSQPQRG